MKRFQIGAPAVEELTAAIKWYETQRRGLGGEFYDLPLSRERRLRLSQVRARIAAPLVG